MTIKITPVAKPTLLSSTRGWSNKGMCESSRLKVLTEIQSTPLEAFQNLRKTRKPLLKQILDCFHLAIAATA